MIKESRVQSDAREKYIKHHFPHPKLTKEQANQIGFLGEFAACKFFNIDWKKNIRPNYETIDSFDIMLKNAKVDVKTESVDNFFFQKLLEREVNETKPDGIQLSIKDDTPYGRRLINSGQKDELVNKHVILFGAVNRDSLKADGKYLHELSGWLPLGYITTNNVLKYPITRKKPFFSQDYPNYPTDVMAVRSSHLLSIGHLMSRYQKAISVIL